MATRFIVEVARKDTGAEQQLVIDADDPGQAEQVANSRDFLVAAVRPAEILAPAVSPVVQTRDWRASSAHLLLLSKFRHNDSPTKYRDAGYWEAALNEKPENAVQRFIQEAMLEPADLLGVLDYRYKATDLKSMLKGKGLKVSGRKDELIRRLIENDAQGMSDTTKGLAVYRCTAEGMKLVESYREREQARREAAEQQVLSLLSGGEYKEAVRAVAGFEATQVFARGIGIDWKNYDGASDVESLKLIFTMTPAILKGIDESQLIHLRRGAAMMHLWGAGTAKQWLPLGFETGTRLYGDAACRMLVFHASHIRNMKAFRETGVRTVEVSGAGDDGCCPACQKINGRVYRLDNVPDLPYAKCTSEDGCRCTLLAKDYE